MEFAGKKHLFSNRPHIKIISFKELSKDKKYLTNPRPFIWGVDDSVLLNNLKTECLLQCKTGKPFFIAALTVNTHFPNGYLPPGANAKKEYSYPEVVKYTDRQLANFVKWVKEQSFANDTTLIIVGDHLSMPTSLTPGLEKYGKSTYPSKRKTYNCFINSVPIPEKRSGRFFSTFDLMPTILHAAGAEWGSDRLHLGVSLFGKTPTLLEKYGIKQYETESLKFSKKYLQLF